MKKKFLLLVLLAASVSTYANTGIDDDESKTDVVLKKTSHGDFCMHLGVGVNLVSGAPDGYEFAPFKSWDIQWTVLQYDYKPKGASQKYSIGLGLNWSNYGLKENNTMLQKTNNVVELGKFPENTESRWSSIRTLSINVPLLFTQKVSKDFSFSVGPIVHFNVDGWLNNKYDQGDQSYKISTKKIGQRAVTVDVMGILDIYGIGIFCKYTPMKVLKNDRGPQFNSFSVGLYL